MERKISKKKIVLVIILVIILITLPTFGRYVYNNIRDMYLISRNFNFTSDVLATTPKTYRYANWSGVEIYEIDMELYSYENELSLFTYEGGGLGYDLTCTLDQPSKATVHINATSGESSSNEYIPNDTNIDPIKIYLKPTGALDPGDTIVLTVEAQTTIPYQKKISAKFQIKISEELISYKITDEPNSIYATLELINAKNEQNKIKLAYDPEAVMIDTSDELYVNRVTQTTTTVSGVTYVNSVTITLDPETSKNIKFYKRNKNQDYTYPKPSGTGTMIITITELGG